MSRPSSFVPRQYDQADEPAGCDSTARLSLISPLRNGNCHGDSLFFLSISPGRRENVRTENLEGKEEKHVRFRRSKVLRVRWLRLWSKISSRNCDVLDIRSILEGDAVILWCCIVGSSYFFRETAGSALCIISDVNDLVKKPVGAKAKRGLS